MYKATILGAVLILGACSPTRMPSVKENATRIERIYLGMTKQEVLERWGYPTTRWETSDGMLWSYIPAVVTPIQVIFDGERVTEILDGSVPANWPMRRRRPTSAPWSPR